MDLQLLNGSFIIQNPLHFWSGFLFSNQSTIKAKKKLQLPAGKVNHNKKPLDHGYC